MKKNFSLLFILIAGSAFAQVFPVQVSVHLTPPYSPYLSDYTAPGGQNFAVHVRCNDLSLSGYRCRLRITLEGVGISLTTKEHFQSAPIILAGGGVPEVYYGEDLREYLAPGALDFHGYSRDEYEKSGRLPEGVYRFSVEVLDYNRGTVVSNRGMATAWIVLNDPPLLSLPLNHSKVDLHDPANILFTWTPRHSASPNAAFTTDYLFRLVEIWPENRSPEDAILTQSPLYEVATTGNQLLYGVSEPALLPGRRYAWQVQARDAEGKDLFKNGGRSEVFVFQFGDALPVPQNLQLRWAKPTTLSLRWDPVRISGPEEIKYRLSYRPRRRVPDHRWYETRTKFTEKTLYDLQPNTEYEFRVRAETDIRESEYTEVLVFKTLREAEPEFVCRETEPPPPPADNLPVFPLSVNDTLRAGGYDVLVRDVVQVDGKYFGSGFVIVPWLNGAKIRVTFEGIRVNDQFRLTRGSIKSVWKEESSFVIEEQTPMAAGSAPQAGELDITVVTVDSIISVEGPALIAAVTQDDEGNVVVTTTDGQEQIIPKGESVSVVDNAGNGYVVDRQGNIAKTTATEARAAAARGERKYEWNFRFSRGDGKFGFDVKKFETLAPYYQQADNGTAVPWKAVSTSRPDRIEGALLSGDVDLKSLRFRVGPSWIMPVALDRDKVTLHVHGRGAGLEQELLAIHQLADTLPETVVGKVNLASYNSLRYNLVLVPVNGVPLPGGLTEAAITEGLNDIYRQAVIEWKVTLAEGIEVPFEGTFDDGETGLLSNYTSDMKKVLNAWGRMEANTWYLFIIDEPRNMGTLGYMPRRRQAGFVFAAPHRGNREEFIKTIAHELGHGAFNLKHTFSEHPLPAGITDNIMDYSTGTALYKYQWDQIHEPQGVMDLFQGDGVNAREGLSEEELMDRWHDLPPYQKAAEILAEHLGDTRVYENVKHTCDADQCVVTADLKVGDDITYTIEISLASTMSADDLIMVLISEYRVDLWEAFDVRAENIWDELYHWWRKQNDDLAQQKGWQVSTLNFLADCITAPTMVPAVQGWITGKHWRDGHDLAGWEQGLSILDIFAPGELANGCITRLLVRIGSKTINVLRIPEVSRKIISTAIESGLKVDAFSDTEFILKTAAGDNIARIHGQAFYLLHNGKQIAVDVTKTTTLLGRYNEGMSALVLGKFNRSKMFRVLDIEGWTKPTAPSAGVQASTAFENATEFWKLHNQPFIDDVIRQGDEVVLLSDPTVFRNLFYSNRHGKVINAAGVPIDYTLTGNISTDIRNLLSENGFPTMFGREVVYLAEKLSMSVEELSIKFFR